MVYLFDLCVVLLVYLADITGTTYKQINVIIFCIIWPLFTLALIWAVWHYRRASKRRRKAVPSFEARVAQLLADRHNEYLSFVQPYPGVDKQGKPAEVCQRVVMSVHDCVQYQRAVDKRYTDLPDERLLMDFIVGNWVDTERLH